CSFFFQAEDGIRDFHVTGVQTCALPIYSRKTLSHKSTDLIKAIILAQKNDLLQKADSLEQVLNRNNRMQYLHAVNFVLKNNTHEVAPYITLTDVVPVSNNELDTIYGSFSPEIAQSKYGKILKEYLELIKK